MIIPEIRDSFRRALHEDLADATTLVWLIQNALTSGTEAKDLIVPASALVHRANVILGSLSRWECLEREL